ncbi:MAG TPA: GTPase HflX, partial [Accumulibacter sp.]|nr:GTPase HflX [Accumulibacter sp.]
MFERSSGRERAVLVQLDFSGDDTEDRLAELRLLARSAGAEVCAVVQGRRHSPDAATFAGKGKVEEIAAEVAAHQADLVIFNHELSAVQERNLERALSCRVIDRTSLILDIFAQRAQSAEGK